MVKELKDKIIEDLKTHKVEDDENIYLNEYFAVFYNPDTKQIEVACSEYNEEFEQEGKGKPFKKHASFFLGSVLRSISYDAEILWYQQRTTYLWDLSKMLFEKDYPYSGLEQFDDYVKTQLTQDSEAQRMFYLFMYMKMYIENNNLEKVSKIYPEIILFGTYNEEIFHKCFKPKGKNMKEITGLPDRIWKLLIKMNASLQAWDRVRVWDKQNLKEEGKHFDDEDVETLVKIGGVFRKKTLTDFKYIIKHTVDEDGKRLFTIGKLNRYLERVDMYQAIDRCTAIEILRDYVEMCNHLEITPITDSNSLKREHDVTARLHSEYARKEWEEKENKRLQEQLQKFENVYPELEKYVYEDDELKVIVPHSPKNMIDESRMNRNCMSSYIDRFANGLSKIFFIRRKENPDMSYISVELNSTLTDYRQAYYACNQPVTKKSDLSFIKNWLENNKKLRNSFE